MSIKYAIDGETYTQSFILDDVSKVIELEHKGEVQWIYPNANQGGYYRWKLAPELLQPLVANAQDLLTPTERMGLVSNLSAMLSAGQIEANDYLAALESFSTEREPYVMYTVINQLEIVRDALVSEGSKTEFAVMVGRLLGPAAESYGLDPVDGESNALTTVRPSLLEWLIRDARDADLTAEFDQRGKAFIEDGADLHSSLVSPALLATAINGDRDTYARFKRRFEDATTPVERSQMLVGLTHFESEEMLVDLQSYSISSVIRPREVMSIREELMKRPEPREIVFDFALSNYAKFEARLPGNGLALLPSVAKGCSVNTADRATDFFSQPVTEPEINIGIKGGCYFIGIGKRFCLRHFGRHVVFFCIVFYCFDHLVIKYQLVNERLLMGQLERTDFNIEPCINFFNNAVYATA